MLRTLILIFTSVLLLSSCSWFEQTPREKYEKKLKKESPGALAKWEAEILGALEHEAAPRLPYSAKGHLLPDRIEAFSFNTSLRIGEKLQLQLKPNVQGVQMFAELYQKTDNPEKPYSFLTAAGKSSLELNHEVTESGEYKILIAGEAGIASAYELHLSANPLYLFPVKGGENSDIKSLWGAPRDGGKRSHEGIDIFADKGTDLIAVTDGKIELRDGGLGGKQVWLYDRQRRIRIYYAHLDNQIARDGSFVNAGDVVGTVGNTGNAKTTPPHLHFGTYLSKRGAQNPIGFVEKKPISTLEIVQPLENKSLVEVQTSRLNLRTGNYKNAPIVRELSQGMPLIVLEAAGEHYHVRTPSGDAGFVLAKAVRFQ